jgi:hypothetical protein
LKHPGENMKKLFTLILLAITLVYAEDTTEFVDGIVVMTSTDPFEDSIKTLYLLPAQGESITNPTQVLAINCSNQDFVGMVLLFDGYLNSGELGELKYRVDTNEPVTTSVTMKDRGVLFHSGINEQDMKNMLTGSKLVVRATSYDNDTYTAEYDLTNLKQTVTACSLPTDDVLSER